MAPVVSVTVPVIALDFTCANSGLLKVASAISNASRTCNPNLPPNRSTSFIYLHLSSDSLIRQRAIEFNCRFASADLLFVVDRFVTVLYRGGVAVRGDGQHFPVWG